MTYTQRMTEKVRDEVVSHLSKNDTLELRDGSRGWRQEIEVDYNGKHIADITFRQKYSFDPVYITLKHAGIEPRQWHDVPRWKEDPYREWNWSHRTYQNPASVANAVVQFISNIPSSKDREIAEAERKARALYNDARRIYNGLTLDPNATKRLLEELDSEVIRSFGEEVQTALGRKIKRLGQYYAKHAEYEAAREAADAMRKE